MGKKRRKGSGRYVALPHVILNSRAWMVLSSDARCLFIELKRRYNGSNNGFISLSLREAATVFQGSKSTARKRLQELVNHGFVKCVHKGHYQNRHATTWLLTTETDNRNGHAPSHEWKNHLRMQEEI